MSPRRKIEEPPDDDDDDLEEVDDDDDDDDDEEEDEDDEDAPTWRDFTMARLGAARASLQASIDAVDEVLMLFVEPSHDKSGKKREELMDAASEAAGAASRSLECASEGWEEMDADEVREEEPEPEDAS